MSLLLALDASGPAISVAILRDGTLVAHHQQALARGHAERLPPALAAAMAASRARPRRGAARLARPPLIVTGDAATMIAAAAGLVIAPAAPDARVIARLAAARWVRGEAMPAAPLYLRPPDATLPAAGGRLR